MLLVAAGTALGLEQRSVAGRQPWAQRPRP
jgi:hypothetical protein